MKNIKEEKLKHFWKTYKSFRRAKVRPKATNQKLFPRELRRLYYLPISKECAQKCSYCPSIGAKNPTQRTLEELKRSLIKAKSGKYTAVLLPCNFLSQSNREQTLQTIKHAGFHVVLQVNQGEALKKVHSLLPLLKKSITIYNIIFENYDSRLYKLSQELELSGVYVYYTFIIQPKYPVFKTLEQLPPGILEKLFFYFPYKKTKKQNFFSCYNIHFLIKQIRKKFPNLQVAPPPGIDCFDSDIPEDRNLEPLVEPAFSFAGKSTSIKISLVIPSYNNKKYLLNTIKHLLIQDYPKDNFEIIVVDDGSTDGTEGAVKRLLKDKASQIAFKYIYFKRTRPRRMGDNQFRAGIARNLGVKHSRGKILAFLDSDILVPSHYLRDVEEKLKSWDVIQARRLELKKDVSSEFTEIENIQISRDTYRTDDCFLEDFHEHTKEWMAVDNHWRYVCTHSLSLKKELFEKVGGFRKNYTYYGYEDTEFGYSLSLLGSRFLLNDMNVFHLDHSIIRSEFFKSHLKKKFLLKESAKTFYHNTLDNDVYQHLEWLFQPKLELRLLLGEVYRRLKKPLRHLHKYKFVYYSVALSKKAIHKVYYFLEFQFQKRILRIGR